MLDTQAHWHTIFCSADVRATIVISGKTCRQVLKHFIRDVAQGCRC